MVSQQDSQSDLFKENENEISHIEPDLTGVSDQVNDEKAKEVLQKYGFSTEESGIFENAFGSKNNSFQQGGFTEKPVMRQALQVEAKPEFKEAEVPQNTSKNDDRISAQNSRDGLKNSF